MSQTDTARTPDALPSAAAIAGLESERVAWIDYAKGICILLVCMMHSTLGVGEAMHGEGFMHWVVAFARPFRMPDFFLLSGLFVAHVIDRPWRTYIDRKVLHFFYFYLLWLVIQSAVRFAPTFVREPMLAAEQLAYALVYPFPPLWFIYVLPLYFVLTKLTRGMPLWGMIGLAALLHTVPVKTGWPAIDVFAVHYYVYFLVGYAAAPWVFQFAREVAAHPRVALAALPVWALINGLYAFTPSRFSGYPVLADLPGISIVLGLIGAGAVVTMASLLARYQVAAFVRHCGKHSLVIYVAFMLPMALVRTVLVKSGLITSVGLVSVTVIAAAVLMPLALHRLVRGSPARILFERPSWFTIEARVPAQGPCRTDPVPQQETPTMVRRAANPVLRDRLGGSARPSVTKLHAANQNVPFNTLIGRSFATTAVAEPQATVRFDHAIARQADQVAGLGTRIAGLISHVKDIVSGKPPIVEPPVIAELRPDRLAKAVRSRR